MAPTARRWAAAAAALVLLAAGVAAQQDAGAGGVPGDPGPPEPGSDEGGVPNGGKPPGGYRGMGSPQGGPPFNGPPGVGDGPPQGPPQGPGVGGGGGGMMPRGPNHPPSTLGPGMTRPLPPRGKDLGKPKPPPKPKPGKKAPWVQREVIVADLVFQWDPRTKDIDAKVAQPTAVAMNRCVHMPRIALHCRPRCVAIATNTPHRAGGSLPGATNAVSAARAMRRTVRRNLRLPTAACSHKRC